MKERAEQEAAAAKAAAVGAKEAVPEELRAYGIETCGAAIGYHAYVVNYLEKEVQQIASRILKTATTLNEKSAQLGHLATNLSLQNRINYLCGTNLPTQMRGVIPIFEGALREGRQQAYGMDLHSTEAQWPEQQDTEFTRDQANLRISDGGVGIRDTSEQAFYQ